MQIVTLEPPCVQGQGDHVYRTLEPSLNVAACQGTYALCGSWLSPIARQAAEDADVLVLCQAVDADFLPLMARRRKRGLVTVMEFNDHFLAGRADNPVAAFYANPINYTLAFQLASLADGLQLSTQALADAFGHLNPKQAVFRNAVTGRLSKRGPAAPRLVGSTARALRLGWGGSRGHIDDLTWLMPGLQATLARHPSLQLCIMGVADLRPLFAWVPQSQLVWRDAGSLEAYQAFLEELDIGVAPLCANPFNDCRSDVKYLEYTMAGVPAVFSARPAYASCVEGDETGLLAETLPAFTAQLERLIESASLRQRLATNAQKQVLACRRGPQAAVERLAFWHSLGAKARASASKAPAWALHLPASAQRGARTWVVPLAGAEADLHDGLLLGASQDAKRHLERACCQDPDNYLCWLYLALVLRDAVDIEDALQRALALAPTSPSVRQALGQHRLNVGADLGDTPRLEPPGDVFSEQFGFAPLCEIEGRHAAIQGRHDQAEQAFKRALAQNSWYRLPATRLAQLQISRGRLSEAEDLLRGNVALTPAHWLDYFLLGELAGEQGAWRRAKHHFEAARRCGAPAAQVGARLAQSYAALGDAAGARRALAGAKAAQHAAAPRSL